MDPRFVDVDFTQDPAYVFGAMPDVPPFGKFAAYADEAPVIPESQWKELAEQIKDKGGNEWLVTRVYNQGNEGSCVANACSQAHEILQAKQLGKENVTHLSAISLYKRIGRSPNSGAMVSDGLDEMSNVGILPLDNAENKAKYPHTMPATGFYNKFPDGWEATAKLFRSLEWLVVDSRDELISALFNGHPVVVGRAGHSICYVKPVYDGGSLYVGYVNSWLGWGQPFGTLDHGFGFDSERLIRSSSGWAFALRAVV